MRVCLAAHSCRHVTEGNSTRIKIPPTLQQTGRSTTKVHLTPFNHLPRWIVLFIEFLFDKRSNILNKKDGKRKYAQYISTGTATEAALVAGATLRRRQHF